MKTLIISLKLLFFMTILTGIVYPIFVFIIARTVFPQKSEGSFIEVNGKIIGSGLIAQKFESGKYFQSRPSAVNYQPMPSGGSNLGPTSRTLRNKTDSIRQAYINFNGLNKNSIVPMDAIFASASGIDPHISVENAMLQISRITKERGFDLIKQKQVIEIIEKNIERPQFGLLGEERINVLILNLELDKL